MPFTPVAVADFLKKSTDLLTKKFKSLSSNTFTVKSTDGEGMDIESKISKVEGFDSSTKIKYNHKSTGTKCEFYVDSSFKLTGSAENTKVVDGLKVKGAFQAIPPALVNPKKDVYSKKTVSAKFSQDMVNASLDLDFIDQLENKDCEVAAYNAIAINGAVSTGKDGMSVGASFKALKQGEKFSVPNWGIGAHVAKGDTIFSAMTKQASGAKVGVYHTLGAKNVVAFQTDASFSDIANAKASVGIQHKFSKDLLLQANVSRAKVIQAVAEYNVADISSKVQLTTQYDLANSENKFSLCCTYGEQ